MPEPVPLPVGPDADSTVVRYTDPDSDLRRRQIFRDGYTNLTNIRNALSRCSAARSERPIHSITFS